MLLFLVGCLLPSWFGDCAQPIRELWPPAAGEKVHKVIVSVDGWHSVIGIWPRDDPDGLDMSRLQEWSYSEKNYYLEGDTGCCGTLRALFVPSLGSVQVAEPLALWTGP